MAEDYIEKTQRAYAASPNKYVESTSEMVPMDELNQFIGLLPNQVSPVLDAGSASGRDAEAMVGAGIKAQGIDLSDELLDRARKLHPDIDFKKMDVRRLEFPDNHFGGVWSNAVLHHLEDGDLTKAISEMFRVLMPGGALCISLKEGEGSRWVEESFSSDLARFYNFKTAHQLEALLRDLGFKVVSSHTRNEKEMFGPDYRDLNWVWVFANKPVGEEH